jgi:hypothetical protein
MANKLVEQRLLMASTNSFLNLRRCITSKRVVRERLKAPGSLETDKAT